MLGTCGVQTTHGIICGAGYGAVHRARADIGADASGPARGAGPPAAAPRGATCQDRDVAARRGASAEQRRCDRTDGRVSCGQFQAPQTVPCCMRHRCRLDSGSRRRSLRCNLCGPHFEGQSRCACAAKLVLQKCDHRRAYCDTNLLGPLAKHSRRSSLTPQTPSDHVGKLMAGCLSAALGPAPASLVPAR